MRSILLISTGLGIMVLAGGCDTFRGGSHESSGSGASEGPKVSGYDTPPAVISAFNQTHPRENLNGVHVVTLRDGATAFEARYTANDGSSQRILYDAAGNELPSSQLPGK